jgi:5-methylthioribose kinase
MSTQLRLTDANLPDYLKNAGVIPRGEAPEVEPVGDGNINWVRRVRGPSGSRIVKQARPALERFPEYRVSTERIVFEARFYETVVAFDAGRICPEVFFFDPEQRVLVLEDLGTAERLDAALSARADTDAAAAALANFLGTLHRRTQGASLAERFANHEMQRLHGDHIFHLPYRPNDFPLSPAVAERAARLRADRDLVTTIDAVYERYLTRQAALVHGDVQPANVLLAPGGPKLLDAEIAHVGDPAFDVGQLLGHLLLPAAARGEPAAVAPALRKTWASYREASGPECAVRSEDVARYAGIELLRRTLGAARLPAVASDIASLAVVETGLRLLHEGLELEDR